MKPARCHLRRKQSSFVFWPKGKITRVGSTISREVDVRVLVATHRNLLNEVEKGRFRQDLYYRLAIVPIEVPPLRERMEDVPALGQSICLN